MCECEPGFVACGGSCVDVTSDGTHCGACDVVCSAKTVCQHGLCESTLVPALPPSLGESSASPSFDLTPGACYEYESRPVMSANTETLFQADANETVSWASPSTPGAWSISGYVVAASKMSGTPITPGVLPPQCGPAGQASQTACPDQASGDTWATTSGFSKEDYIFARTSWDYWMPPYKSATAPDTCKVNDDCVALYPQFCKPAGQCYCEQYGLTPSVGCYIHSSAPAGVAIPAPATPTAPSILRSGGFPNATWAIPPSSADDGLNATFDAGGSSLWLAATCGFQTGASVGDQCLALFPTCKTGTVDSPACARAKIGSADGMLDLDAGFTSASHTTVIVNPCTHHALVSFIENDAKNAYLVVEAVDHKGTVVANWKKTMSPQFDTQCSDAGSKNFDCTGAWSLCPDPTATDTDCDNSDSGVSRIVPRGQMDVKVTQTTSGTTCTLYVGWDEPMDTLGPMRRYATLGSIDVTGTKGNESSTAKFAQLTQTALAAGESIDATPVASRFGDGLALIYVQRDPTGMTQTLRARVTTDPTFKVYTDIPVSPAQSGPGPWMGDNNAQLLGGLPGGELLATWPQQLTSSCTDIDGSVLKIVPVPTSPRIVVPVDVPLNDTVEATSPPSPPDPTAWQHVLDDRLEGAPPMRTGVPERTPAPTPAP
jgi:hypothetical protein